MIARHLFAVALFTALTTAAYGQNVDTLPYTPQVRTAPDIGNLQGVRYGYPLRTAPDQGEGFSFHIHPVAFPQGNSSVLLNNTSQPGVFVPGPGGATRELTPNAKQAMSDLKKAENTDARVKALTDSVQLLINQVQVIQANQSTPVPVFAPPAPPVAVLGQPMASPVYQGPLYQTPRDVTRGMRNHLVPQGVPVPSVLVPGAPAALLVPNALVAAAKPSATASTATIVTATETGTVVTILTKAPHGFSVGQTVVIQGVSVDNYKGIYAITGVPSTTTFTYTSTAANLAQGTGGFATVLPAAQASSVPAPPANVVTATGAGVYPQPLIQVKMRVVQVDRSNILEAASVLDYVGSPGHLPTLINGNNVNNNRRNTSGGSRFSPLPPGLIDFTGLGLSSLMNAGGLVNLTTGNLNYILRVLQNEFQADLITAPQVVALNGQNVEFVTGQKVPFVIGQNVINGNNNNIQQFFYKGVGTFISVTPHIVNYGAAYGSGRGKAPLVEGDIADWWQLVTTLKGMVGQNDLGNAVKDFLTRPASAQDRENILGVLNQYPRDVLIQYGLCIPDRCHGGKDCDNGCDWRPEDCTVDLEVIMRLSDVGNQSVGLTTGTSPGTVSVNIEDNVRAIADTVQVKSGHGVVIGGLISATDNKSVAKIPVLGDIPGVGFFFRSKVVTRAKTEILLFIEAQVLPPCAPAARAESARDFPFGGRYVAGDFLDNPLEFGMYRAGFGPYLPPHSAQEKVFWERLGRKVRTISTTLDDLFE